MFFWERDLYLVSLSAWGAVTTSYHKTGWVNQRNAFSHGSRWWEVQVQMLLANLVPGGQFIHGL